MAQREKDRLSKLSGAAFDREYVKMMVKDHEKDVAAFKRESQQAKDPDLKAWAGKTLPTLEDHLQMIKRVQSQVAAKK
jgi:putative membrane protein